MAVYVISDIHGCYDTFIKLLENSEFDINNDVLYILGDIIDRGDKTLEMYEWVKERINKNVFMILGNHEDMFISDVMGLRGQELWSKKFACENSGVEFKMTEQEKQQYNYFMKDLFGVVADQYGTIKDLRRRRGLSISELEEMANFFQELPLYYEVEVNGKIYTLVHAFCRRKIEDTSRDDFVWNRSLANPHLGVEGKHVIFGHTPTICEEYDAKGGVVITNLSENTSTMNIDCGCVWDCLNSSLGIVRLDDMKIWYQKNIDNKI